MPIDLLKSAKFSGLPEDAEKTGPHPEYHYRVTKF
jgi:hypothetical protein